jgi:hypothetical protein
MGFDINRLRRGDWITGGGAVAFFVFLFFFDWYGASYKGPASIGGPVGSLNYTGWHTFTDSRWIWLITIVVALCAVALVASERKLDIPLSVGTIVAGLGALSTLLILYRIVHHPSGGASFAGGSFSYGIKLGIWLGLIAAAATTYGGYLTMSEEAPSSPLTPASVATPQPMPPEESLPLPPSSPSSAGEGSV